MTKRLLVDMLKTILKSIENNKKPMVRYENDKDSESLTLRTGLVKEQSEKFIKSQNEENSVNRKRKQKSDIAILELQVDVLTGNDTTNSGKNSVKRQRKSDVSISPVLFKTGSVSLSDNTDLHRGKRKCFKNVRMLDIDKAVKKLRTEK